MSSTDHRATYPPPPPPPFDSVARIIILLTKKKYLNRRRCSFSAECVYEATGRVGGGEGLALFIGTSRVRIASIINLISFQGFVSAFVYTWKKKPYPNFDHFKTIQYVVPERTVTTTNMIFSSDSPRNRCARFQCPEIVRCLSVCNRISVKFQTDSHATSQAPRITLHFLCFTSRNN